MGKLKIPCKDFSSKVFSKYPIACELAQKFLDDVNLDGELNDRIYGGNGTSGYYCIVYLDFTTFKLSVNLNISGDRNRIDTNVCIPELSQQYGNYCSYEELVEKIKEINTIK